MNRSRTLLVLLLTAVVMVVGSFFLIWLSTTQSGRR